jgi:predicted HNH restriction endonuclease
MFNSDQVHPFRLQAMADRSAIPTPDRFAAALARMEAEGRLSMNDREMLTCHYNVPRRTLTGRQMSELMGWGSSVAHAHYGKLGRRLAEELDWVPTEREGFDGYDVSKLMLGGRAEDGAFEWTMRPQLVRALELLEWPELRLPGGMSLSRSRETVIERAAYTWQQTLERNSRAAKLAKAHHGHQCQACDMGFADIYGPIGDDFIEAHHLVPLAHINLGAERAYTLKDFAVLCSNCHRMIHRWPDPADPQPWDLDGFARMVRARRNSNR